ncbi:BrnT family toxin [uncultured Paracoccus sp.]|uniref:BrnT family toxin n=1 Tax=uncultured Paracoccus sp. TaxID=189685 RepID=UPI002625A46C|nr:BrnT family toxin [uncultured Paracoccus sp.]
MSSDEQPFEWDERKRLITLEKHGIDFVRAAQVLLGQHVEIDAHSESEPRYMAIGLAEDQVISVVFTRRDSAIRIITARRARRNEREYFRALFGGSDPPDEGQD